MSQRHRSAESAPLPKADVRAHAHNERHRIHAELQAVAQQVSSGIAADDVHEPGRGWVVESPREPGRIGRESGRTTKHWKLKMWKRRTNVRAARARASRLIARQA